jgi:hypothetical protein
MSSAVVIWTDLLDWRKRNLRDRLGGQRLRDRGAAGQNDQNQASVATACSRRDHGLAQLMT